MAGRCDRDRLVANGDVELIVVALLNGADGPEQRLDLAPMNVAGALMVEQVLEGVAMVVRKVFSHVWLQKMADGDAAHPV